jgi:hypothetical protein
MIGECWVRMNRKVHIIDFNSRNNVFIFIVFSVFNFSSKSCSNFVFLLLL